MSTHGEAVEDIKKAKGVLDAAEATETISHPDPKKHLYISLVKSIIRIGAGGCLIQGNLLFAGGLLILAEILGVVEELV